MSLDDFLYNYQYKRKIAFYHFMFSKPILMGLTAIAGYYLFLKTNTKYDALAYLLIIGYMVLKYIKTNLIFSDKINHLDRTKNIFLYRFISLKKKNINKEYTYRKEKYE